MNKFVIIHPLDNVGVALVPLKKGEIITSGNKNLTLITGIPAGHKFALKEILQGSPVIKYGSPIGTAIKDIRAGEHIHSHNLTTALTGTAKYAYKPEMAEEAIPKTAEKSFFNGYLRPDGGAGIRNDIWIIPMVGCVNSLCKALERAGKAGNFPGVTDVAALTHQFGCSQTDEDLVNFQKMLAGLSKNANAAGVLFVALGCENNTIESFIKVLGNYSKERIRFITAQDEGDEFEAGMREISKLAAYAAGFSRQKLPVSMLMAGLKCGGSDGLSGITANPAIGRFADLLTAQGGTAILTEVPEMFGAEQVLLPRCVDRQCFLDYAGILTDFRDYYTGNGRPVFENPSPGNKDGGITTLEEKSLGCVLKGGTGRIVKALPYCEGGALPGLNVMSAPGNDLIATTALAASGAVMVLFSTGRGTPFAGPVPTVKISSNTALYDKKPKWIDFDAGALASGGSLDTLGSELFQLALKIASGEKVKSEIYGGKEIAFFKTGVIL